MDAGGQRRVEALVEPLRDEHLVGHHVELRVLVEHALQLQQVGDQVGPLLRALEVEQHRLGLRLEARERLVTPHARVGLLDRLERGGGHERRRERRGAQHNCAVGRSVGRRKLMRTMVSSWIANRPGRL